MLETPSILCYAYSVIMQLVRTISRKVKLAIIVLIILFLLLMIIGNIWTTYCSKNSNKPPENYCYRQQTSCGGQDANTGYFMECYESWPIYRNWQQELRQWWVVRNSSSK